MIHINLANNLTNKVKDNALAKLKEEPENYFYMPRSPLKNFIAFLYSENIIKQKELEEALELAVFKQAENDLNLLLSPRNVTGRYADNAPKPEILAYAIEKRIFSKDEERRIPLDHDMTPESFCRTHGGRDLVCDLMQDLMDVIIIKPYDANKRTQALLEQLEADNYLRQEIHL